ncbi:MAG: YbaN family protein, partial [Gemmatimonadales bacterium]
MPCMRCPSSESAGCRSAPCRPEVRPEITIGVHRARLRRAPTGAPLPPQPVQGFLSRMRVLWLLLGHVFVGVGLIGALLPVLPTTPFMILAAWSYSKGSKRFEAWLLNHATFGPPI